MINLAVHASQRRPVVERIAAAGKPILSQKPFALHYADALSMVETCERAGVSSMIYAMSLEYAPEAELMTSLHFNNIVQSRAAHSHTWYFDGTEGSAWATQSELHVSFKDSPLQTQTFALQGSWFPDAFGGSMAERMWSLAQQREPQTSGRANLNSIKIAYAAIRSGEEGRTVALSEIA